MLLLFILLIPPIYIYLIDFLNIDRVVEDVKGNIIAGILAKMYCWNCLYIDVLWVEEGYRKDGLGSKLY